MCIRDRVGADKVRRTVMGAFLVVAADITVLLAPVPVSYTHLDVYKRQEALRAPMLAFPA